MKISSTGQKWSGMIFEEKNILTKIGNYYYQSKNYFLQQ